MLSSSVPASPLKNWKYSIEISLRTINKQIGIIEKWRIILYPKHMLMKISMKS
jgi:hypothetical protein